MKSQCLVLIVVPLYYRYYQNTHNDMGVCFSVSLFFSFKQPQRERMKNVRCVVVKSLGFLELASAIEWLFIYLIAKVFPMCSPAHTWICPLCPPGWTTVRNSNQGFLEELLLSFPVATRGQHSRELVNCLWLLTMYAFRELGWGVLLWTVPPALQISQGASFDINGWIKYQNSYWKILCHLKMEILGTFSKKTKKKTFTVSFSKKPLLYLGLFHLLSISIWKSGSGRPEKKR